MADVVSSALVELCLGGIVSAQGTANKLEPLRLFVILLLFPGLMEPEHHNTIFKRLCAAMNLLSNRYITPQPPIPTIDGQRQAIRQQSC